MTLAQQLSKHFCMINSRLTTFVGIVKSMLLRRGITYKNLSEEIASNTNAESQIKSISRFLQGSHIPDENFYLFMKSFLPNQKAVLSIDRTIWETEKIIRNILVLALSFDGVAMPILFKIIPYKGPCNSADQIEIISLFVKKFGLDKILAVVGDREFDSQKFMTFLHTQKIPFVLRVRKQNRIINQDNKTAIIKNLKLTSFRNFKTIFYKLKTKFDHIITKSGDYLSLISSLDIDDALKIYKKRWDIELAFKGCKTGGFRIEETHIRNQSRFINLIKCVFISCALVIKIGDKSLKRNPVKIKKTLGCRVFSLLEVGFRIVRAANKKSHITFNKLLDFTYNPNFLTTLDFFVR